MILTGYDLHLFQSCPRRYRLEKSYRYLSYHPTVLFSAVMRKAILDLSSGKDKHSVSAFAVNQLLTLVKSPGMDVPTGTNTYTLAMDMAASVRTILEYLSRCSLLTLTPKPIEKISNSLYWSYLSPMDQSGILHRWKFSDSLSDDSILRESHTWEVFADLCLSKAPMSLHLVHIGRRDGSHRASNWCRVYKSPAIANHFRFQKKSGHTLTGDWKPVYFSDNPDNDPVTWVDLLESDSLPDQSMIRHVNIREPGQQFLNQFNRDLINISSQISSLPKPFTSIPMSRPSCDSPYTCPHQQVCYSQDPDKTINTSKYYSKL